MSLFKFKKIWSMVIGGGLLWTGVYSKSQGNYQRFLAVPTRKDAQKYYYYNSYNYLLKNVSKTIVGFFSKSLNPKYFMGQRVPHSLFLVWVSCLF